jgi:hypothetical protein
MIDYSIHRERVRLYLDAGLSYNDAIARANAELKPQHRFMHPTQVVMHQNGRPIGRTVRPVGWWL